MMDVAAVVAVVRDLVLIVALVCWLVLGFLLYRRVSSLSKQLSALLSHLTKAGQSVERGTVAVVEAAASVGQAAKQVTAFLSSPLPAVLAGMLHLFGKGSKEVKP